VTPEGVQQPIVLPPADQIRRWVESYRRFIEQDLGDPLSAANEAGRHLYESLVAPAARWIPPGSSVTIFPDDALYWINFETLPVYGGPSGRPSHFWIEDARLSVAPSLGALGIAKERPVRISDSLLIIGNPIPPSEEFPSLAYASQEIRTIRSSLPKTPAVELTRALARPAAYRDSSPAKFSMLHFSTHAVANKMSPLDSAIVLSPDDGAIKLYARDIMDIPLNAELVTISACRTAGARSYSGEGLVGFAWAFQHAGARNVIAGLWNVTDSSTPEMMGSLYSALARGMTPRDALRQAKLALIHSGRTYQKPYYWGPFQLYAR
jgi:CHAT domain-containing protein